MGVSGVARVLLVQSKDGETATRQVFGTLARRVFVSVVVTVGTSES